MVARHPAGVGLWLTLVAAVAVSQLGAQSHPNTLTGRVTIVTVDGLEERVDRSGVVVFLERVDGVVSQGTKSRPVVSQRGQAFSPRVLVVTNGSEVTFTNDDITFHNVFSLSSARPFDLDVYAQGEVRSVSFPSTGLVKVYCHIHPDMAASILVLRDPLFATTDASGRFRIPNIPDGTYTLRGWSELGGEYAESIVVAGGADERDIRIRETRRSLPHLNKFGQPYPRKY